MKRTVLLITLMVLALPASAHRWAGNECAVAGNDAAVVAQDRDEGDTEIQVKERMLYALKRPSPNSMYQDAEDLYLFLAIVDYVYMHHSDSPQEVQMHVSTACARGLNRA